MGAPPTSASTLVAISSVTPGISWQYAYMVFTFPIEYRTIQ